MEVSPYEIVLIRLDPTEGSEIKKTRPCVVISPKEMNTSLNTVIIAPMTSSKKPYPTRVRITHEGQNGYIALEQIRTVDKRRIIKSLGHVRPATVRTCKTLIKQILVS